MHQTSNYNRNIRRYGRDFRNLISGQTIKGFLPPEGRAIFMLDADLNPGDSLIEQAQGRHFVIADIKRDIGHQSVDLLECHLVASLIRAVDGPVNTFGRCTADSVTIASALPVVFKPGEKLALVPVTSTVRQGDLLRVESINGSYAVTGVAHNLGSGLLIISVAKQDCSSILSRM